MSAINGDLRYKRWNVGLKLTLVIVALSCDNFENWNDELTLHIVEFEEEFIEFELHKNLTFLCIKN